MTFIEAKDMVLTASLTIICTWLAFLFKRLISSIERLNIKIAEIVAHLTYHDQRISKLEERNELRKS